MPAHISQYTHVFNTWETYPRVHYFQKRFRDLYTRYRNITTKEPHASPFKEPKLTEQLESLSCQLENYLRVIVLGRDNLDAEKFVISTEPISHAQDMRSSPIQGSSTSGLKDRFTIVICYTKINAFDSKGLKEVMDTLEHYTSYGETLARCVIGSPLIVCETSMMHPGNETELDRFRTDIISIAHKTLSMNLDADNIVLYLKDSILRNKMSDILERRIIQGFVNVSTLLQEFIGDRRFAADAIDVIESEQLITSIQGFLKNGLGFVDILETMKDKSFIETVLSNLAQVIRCAVMAPLSAKYNLPQDACNRVAHEANFEYKMIQSVSKNTRYHLSKLQKPCEEMVKATKSGNKLHQFPGRNFVFIAYPLREDIKQDLMRLEERLNSVTRTASTMRKMLHEIGGYLYHSVMNQGNEQKTKQTAITDNLRKEIMKIDGVYGMGTFYGRVEIHLKKMEDGKKKEVQKNVYEIMDNFRFLQPYQVVSVLQEPKQFCFESGRRIECECPQNKCQYLGTLGCFVHSGDGQLYGLTCAHVVHGEHKAEHDVFITSGRNGRRLFARSRPEMTIFSDDDKRSFIDIAAVKVLEREVQRRCTTNLRNEDGNVKPTELYTETVDELAYEQVVHKYGAGSDLTRGIICSTDFSVYHADARDHLVLIERLPGSDDRSPYATEGDSGSINCMTTMTEHDEIVKAVSMLRAGEYKVEDSDLCMSFLLHKGIEKLKESTGIDLQLNA